MKKIISIMTSLFFSIITYSTYSTYSAYAGIMNETNDINFSGNVGISNEHAITGLTIHGNTNSYYQAVIHNMFTGNNASSDWVAQAGDGSETNWYIDLGINNSIGGTIPFVYAHDAYLYSSDGNLDIGAGMVNTTNASIQFYVGSNMPNPMITISQTGLDMKGYSINNAKATTRFSVGDITSQVFTTTWTPLSNSAVYFDNASGWSNTVNRYFTGLSGTGTWELSYCVNVTNSGVIKWMGMAAIDVYTNGNFYQRIAKSPCTISTNGGLACMSGTALYNITNTNTSLGVAIWGTANTGIAITNSISDIENTWLQGQKE